MEDLESNHQARFLLVSEHKKLWANKRKYGLGFTKYLYFAENIYKINI